MCCTTLTFSFILDATTQWFEMGFVYVMWTWLFLNVLNIDVYAIIFHLSDYNIFRVYNFDIYKFKQTVLKLLRISDFKFWRSIVFTFRKCPDRSYRVRVFSFIDRYLTPRLIVCTWICETLHCQLFTIT